MAKKNRKSKNQQTSQINAQVQSQIQRAIGFGKTHIAVAYWNRSCKDLENYVLRTFKQLKNVIVSGLTSGGFAISWNNTTQGA